MVYFFIATHFPELAHCLRFLENSPDAPEASTVLFPESLAWPLEKPPRDLRRLPPGTVPEDVSTEEARTFFVVLDPLLPPEEQLAPWADHLKAAGAEPAKILTLVDCAAAEQGADLRSFLEQALYHTDLVLLGNRTNAAKAFVRDFQRRYEKACYPCRFALLKGPGLPQNPSEILTPETRRISPLFDPPETSESELAAAGFPLETSWDIEDEALADEEEARWLTDEAEDHAPERDLPFPDVSRWLVTSAPGQTS
jgi:hypothetical protein